MNPASPLITFVWVGMFGTTDRVLQNLHPASKKPEQRDADASHEPLLAEDEGMDIVLHGRRHRLRHPFDHHHTRADADLEAIRLDRLALLQQRASAELAADPETSLGDRRKDQDRMRVRTPSALAA